MGAAAGPAGRIGPNAILQLIPVLDAAGGRALRDRVFAAGGLDGLPDTDGLMDEGPAGAVHRALRQCLPEDAPTLAAKAGHGTADYILAHRIPRLAQGLLKILPAGIAERLLTRAIAQHAWTFAGSGTFSVASLTPLVFEIADNPIVRGERSAHPVCHWHAAVFERLFRVLVDPKTRVVETACGATGAPACRFEVRRG
jgi:divinyl protochlorophyllide a 8-vinyl-reductase